MPLINNYQLDCQAHAEMGNQCAITACKNLKEKRFKTCNITAHREIDNYYYEKLKSLEKLKEELQTLRIEILLVLLHRSLEMIMRFQTLNSSTQNVLNESEDQV